MQTLEFKHTQATVALTVLSVITVLTSLLTKWYWCQVSWTSEGHLIEREYSFYLYGVGTGQGITYYEYTSFSEVGTVIGVAAILILLWALASVPYISKVLDGEAAFHNGWVVLALAVASIAVYAVFIQGAVESVVFGHVSSGLTLGSLMALVAVLMQVGAVLARNIQVLNPRLSGGEVKLTQEELGRGDLPER